MVNWFEQVVGTDKRRFKNLTRDRIHFHEEFKDFDRFLRLWSTPSGCDFTLASEGLRFTNAHLPILTKPLGLLTNLEFTFTARIEQGAIGWVIQGTVDPQRNYPSYCVMFNIDTHDNLGPHILNINHIHPQAFYQPFAPRPVQLKKTKVGWFTITTRCVDDIIVVINGGKEIFRANFAKDAPYAGFYKFPAKQGHVGFRCHPWGEQAVVRNVIGTRDLINSPQTPTG